ncbi:MAG: SDR family oxidoreductase [Chloroflexota bacterium]|jgi:enoyl-[acyl-carrier protein] reductase III|nr:SDR family oxidoreductase [Chloroflexota bacterium]
MIFKNKTLLLTGGSRGIGKKICYKFAQKGCDIIFTYLRSPSDAKKVEKDLKELGVNVISKKLNLNSNEDISKFSNEIKKLNIKIDFLINNAASGVMKDSLETTEKHWDWTMQINAKGPWILSKTISEIMPKNSRIINISSPGSTKVLKNYFSIGVSKAALESITRYMAYDLAPKGINVNSISASMIETDAVKHFPNQIEIKKILERKNPSQKKLLTEHIAKAAIMLCSEESEMIIGQNILVDGGGTLLLS